MPATRQVAVEGQPRPVKRSADLVIDRALAALPVVTSSMWRHIGDEGDGLLPVTWLDQAPRDFYGTSLFGGLQLDEARKTNIRLTHATWEPREKRPRCGRTAQGYGRRGPGSGGVSPAGVEL